MTEIKLCNHELVLDTEMERKKDIQDELSSMGSSLAGMRHTDPRTVPEGYFRQLEADVLALVKEDSQIAKASRNIAMPQADLPEGYFAQVPDTMLQVMKNSEVDAQPAKKASRIYLRPIKWAAAAAVVIAVGVGAYQYKNRDTDPGDYKLLAAVPNNELRDYLQNSYNVDVDRVVLNNSTLINMKLDSKDIISYLDETGWDTVDE